MPNQSHAITVSMELDDISLPRRGFAISPHGGGNLDQARDITPNLSHLTASLQHSNPRQARSWLGAAYEMLMKREGPLDPAETNATIELLKRYSTNRKGESLAGAAQALRDKLITQQLDLVKTALRELFKENPELSEYVHLRIVPNNPLPILVTCKDENEAGHLREQFKDRGIAIREIEFEPQQRLRNRVGAFFSDGLQKILNTPFVVVDPRIDGNMTLPLSSSPVISFGSEGDLSLSLRLSRSTAHPVKVRFSEDIEAPGPIARNIFTNLPSEALLHLAHQAACRELDWELKNLVGSSDEHRSIEAARISMIRSTITALDREEVVPVLVMEKEGLVVRFLKQAEAQELLEDEGRKYLEEKDPFRFWLQVTNQSVVTDVQRVMLAKLWKEERVAGRILHYQTENNPPSVVFLRGTDKDAFVASLYERGINASCVRAQTFSELPVIQRRDFLLGHLHAEGYSNEFEVSPYAGVLIVSKSKEGNIRKIGEKLYGHSSSQQRDELRMKATEEIEAVVQRLNSTTETRLMNVLFGQVSRLVTLFKADLLQEEVSDIRAALSQTRIASKVEEVTAGIDILSKSSEDQAAVGLYEVATCKHYWQPIGGAMFPKPYPSEVVTLAATALAQHKSELGMALTRSLVLDPHQRGFDSRWDGHCAILDALALLTLQGDMASEALLTEAYDNLVSHTRRNMFQRQDLERIVGVLSRSFGDEGLGGVDILRHAATHGVSDEAVWEELIRSIARPSWNLNPLATTLAMIARGEFPGVDNLHQREIAIIALDQQIAHAEVRTVFEEIMASAKGFTGEMLSDRARRCLERYAKQQAL